MHVRNGKVFMNAETDEIQTAIGNGQATVSLSADYGTSMLLMGNSREDLPAKSLINQVSP